MPPDQPTFPPVGWRRALLRRAVGGVPLVVAWAASCARVGDAPAPEATQEPALPSAPPPTPTSPSPAPSTPIVPPSPTQPLLAPTTRSSPTPKVILPTLTVAATSTPVAGAATVAFVKTRDRAEGLRRAVGLLGLNPVRGRTVLLKPNLNSADPPPGSTHPALLRALVEELRVMGAGPITLADRSGMGATRSTMERLGLFQLADDLDLNLVVLDELPAGGWERIRPPDSHWQQGFPFARPCLDCGALVLTCNLKTHRFGGHFTLSLKNAVGMVGKRVPGDGYDYMQELHGSAHQRRMIAEINVAYTPALIVLDGVEAFVRGGPDTGERAWGEVVLAGTDRVAIDAVGVALLRHLGTTPEVSRGPVFGQEQLARAVELRLGVARPEMIRLVTDDPASAAYAQTITSVLAQG